VHRHYFLDKTTFLMVFSSYLIGNSPSRGPPLPRVEFLAKGFFFHFLPEARMANAPPMWLLLTLVRLLFQHTVTFKVNVRTEALEPLTIL